LGSGATGPTTGTLNPGGTSTSAASGTALSAGKYVAPGVSVGVSQGISPPTSKVKLTDIDRDRTSPLDFLRKMPG
jgi:hypothetical protein